jgi:hypothetical protein
MVAPGVGEDRVVDNPVDTQHGARRYRPRGGGPPAQRINACTSVS